MRVSPILLSLLLVGAVAPSSTEAKGFRHREARGHVVSAQDGPMDPDTHPKLTYDLDLGTGATDGVPGQQPSARVHGGSKLWNNTITPASNKVTIGVRPPTLARL